MSKTLTDRIEALDSSADFSDPSTYSKLLGYDEAPAAEAAPAAQEVKGETEAPAVAPATAPAAQESSATPAAAENVEPEPAGVLTKDGKHVIPMSVLTDTRNALQRANDRIKELAAAQERMQQELEARQAGAVADTTAEAEVPSITPEELEELQTDYPSIAGTVAKLAKANEALRAQLQEVATVAKQPAAAPAAAQAVNVQELIDQRPLLSQWQAKGGIAWRTAVETDNALKSDPEWATKPYAERFAEVERRVAEEFGIPVTAPTAAAPAAPAPTNSPAKAPAAPKVQEIAPTLTDFNGSPATVGDPMAGMPVGKMVDQAMNMDMEALRRLAGLSY